MFNLFRLCQKDEISFDIVAKNGNNVEATFEFFETIVRLVAFDNVASTLSLTWTGLMTLYLSVCFHISFNCAGETKSAILDCLIVTVLALWKSRRTRISISISQYFQL